MPKDKYEPPNERRQHRIMQRNEVAEGKQSRWSELEIFGFVQNISGNLWKVEWLTVLYLDNNHLNHIPAQIGSLVNLEHLDASHNFINSVPPEIGELVNLRELKLASNRIRELPCELGKCFQIQTLDLSNNPLSFDINKYYTESSAKLLSALMDSLHSIQKLQYVVELIALVNVQSHVCEGGIQVKNKTLGEMRTFCSHSFFPFC